MDYKNQYLQWIRNNPTFVPKGGLPRECSYLELMTDIMQCKNCTEEVAKMFYDTDRKWKRECADLIRETERADNKKINKSSQFFITIGFNHQTWDIPKCVKVIEKILTFDWIKEGEAVFELYRTNGEHPHVHFLVDITDGLTKSKIVEKLWACAGIKKVVLKKSFIDVKVAQEYHEKYIKGDKIPEKVECCDRDREWRKKNGIPQNFIKQNEASSSL